MDDYLLDRETLGGFVDELMKKRPLPAGSADELNKLREQNMRALDDRVSDAIFSTLNHDQLLEINSLLDDQDASPEVFTDFFQKSNVDLEKVISGAMQSFAADFLGGQNG